VQYSFENLTTEEDAQAVEKFFADKEYVSCITQRLLTVLQHYQLQAGAGTRLGQRPQQCGLAQARPEGCGSVAQGEQVLEELGLLKGLIRSHVRRKVERWNMHISKGNDAIYPKTLSLDLLGHTEDA
jgi:hypothetical protein